MSGRLRAVGRFWYDFVVGDDWRIALAVVVALGLTAVLTARGVPAWWVLPAAVAVVLPASVGREARDRGRAR